MFDVKSHFLRKCTRLANSRYFCLDLGHFSSEGASSEKSEGRRPLLRAGTPDFLRESVPGPGSRGPLPQTTQTHRPPVEPDTFPLISILIGSSPTFLELRIEPRRGMSTAPGRFSGHPELDLRGLKRNFSLQYFVH